MKKKAKTAPKKKKPVKKPVKRKGDLPVYKRLVTSKSFGNLQGVPSGDYRYNTLEQFRSWGLKPLVGTPARIFLTQAFEEKLKKKQFREFMDRILKFRFENRIRPLDAGALQEVFYMMNNKPFFSFYKPTQKEVTGWLNKSFADPKKRRELELMLKHIACSISTGSRYGGHGSHTDTLVIRLLGKKKKPRIFDFGVSTGVTTAALSQRLRDAGFRPTIYGTERLPLYQYLRPQLSKEVKFLRHDLSQGPLTGKRRKKADLVRLGGVLYYSSPEVQARMVRHALEDLKAGGFVVLATGGAYDAAYRKIDNQTLERIDIKKLFSKKWMPT